MLYANNLTRMNNFIKYDKYGDSYSREIDEFALRDILKEMDYMGYEDDLEDPDIVNEDRNLLR